MSNEQHEIKLTELQRDALEIASKVRAFLKKHGTPDPNNFYYGDTLRNTIEIMEDIAVEDQQQENKRD